MKILVISDTHGKIEKALEIYKNLNDIDFIIHCGDFYKDAMQIHHALGTKVVAVHGNCDGSFDENDYEIVETECGNLLITHGHMQNIKRSQENLLDFAESKGCIGAVYGHTHVAAYVEHNGMLLMNPGSLSNPRDGSNGSYGLILTDLNGLKGQIYYCGGKKKQQTSGKLRKLLNFSDRF